jgi:hypothetical protein
LTSVSPSNVGHIFFITKTTKAEIRHAYQNLRVLRVLRALRG